MDDRELLELAAKAAGQERSAAGDLWSNARGLPWDPLTDDGDALRLAVKLQIWIRYRSDSSVNACWYDSSGYFSGNTTEEFGSLRNGDDPYAAPRRAIVRAAAEIGKAMAPSTDGGEG